jgi:hypothetical protein
VSQSGGRRCGCADADDDDAGGRRQAGLLTEDEKADEHGGGGFQAHQGAEGGGGQAAQGEQFEGSTGLREASASMIHKPLPAGPARCPQQSRCPHAMCRTGPAQVAEWRPGAQVLASCTCEEAPGRPRSAALSRPMDTAPAHTARSLPGPGRGSSERELGALGGDGLRGGGHAVQGETRCANAFSC